MKQVNYGEGFDQEIKDLEAKLEAKKKEALEMGTDASEKEIFSQTLKEHIYQESQSSSENVAATGQVTVQPHSVGADQNATEKSQHQLEALIAHALDRGVASAIREARKTENAYLIDKLHDELIDHFYQKLLDSRQISA